MIHCFALCTVVGALPRVESAMPLQKQLATPLKLSALVSNTIGEPVLLWQTENEVISAVWQARESVSVASIGIACPTSTLEISARDRGTLQVLHNGSKESALLPVGFQAGTLQVVPSDEHPSGLQVCSAAAFCVNIWYPAPGELDFVAHVDAKEHGSGLLSMTTLEDWFAVLTDGPPTVDDGPCSQPTQQPIAALETLRPYTHKRSMLLQGRMQQLGRSTI